MTDLTQLIASNAARWAAMHVVTEHVPEIDSVAHRLVSPYAKSVYQAIEALTGGEVLARDFVKQPAEASQPATEHEGAA